MTHANIQHPIVLRMEQTLLSAPGVDDPAHFEAPSEVGRRNRQMISAPDAPVIRPHGRALDVGSKDEPDLPPECWYG